MNATQATNRPTCWWLCEIVKGLDLDGYRLGHRVYAHVTPDGRVLILAKGGRRVTFKTMADAGRHIRRVRRNGGYVRVKDQAKQFERWFEGRSNAA
jgi:hypothetical protein